ncbi:MAG: ATP synthase F1 subunit epsilon [Bacteroidetes bacterium GWF2_33_38]|nr:MAG: ATP synthase F1 subunit epsilon [Bacteroidetes bacterium GWF2_33_38]OFY76150.1 MAG: ATP synthase F1 subunit epsilon [Bacteroidetes bacterium RIFOXYA12_FULL_33_9]OFY91709.1 MAG: ATP synthase F1 subunit epsilon [Bacteroidetes bacterium RIFOXYA2_FULL_33_7]
MYLEIVTPEKKVYEGNIELIQLPGSTGSFEILKSHAPIVSVLQRGSIKVVTQDQDEIFFQIDGGVIEMTNDKIIVLAEMYY